MDIARETFFNEIFCVHTTNNKQLDVLDEYYYPFHRSVGYHNREDFPYIFGNKEGMHGSMRPGRTPRKIEYEEWFNLAYPDEDKEIDDGDYDLDFLFS